MTCPFIIERREQVITDEGYSLGPRCLVLQVGETRRKIQLVNGSFAHLACGEHRPGSAGQGGGERYHRRLPAPDP